MQMAAEAKKIIREAQLQEDKRGWIEAAEKQLQEEAEIQQAAMDYGDYKAQEEADINDFINMNETIRENDEAERVSEDLVKKVKLDRQKLNLK